MSSPEPTYPEREVLEARHRLEQRRRRDAWEAGFLDRAVGMSVGAAVFAACFLLALGRNREAVSYVIGASVSIAMLWSARYAVVHVLTRSDLGKRKKWLSFGLTVSKYGLAGLIIWWLTRWPYAHLPAFVGGVATTQVVLFLKALGRFLTGEAPPAGWRRGSLIMERRRASGFRRKNSPATKP